MKRIGYIFGKERSSGLRKDTEVWANVQRIAQER
jgi:hypothetical protein